MKGDDIETWLFYWECLDINTNVQNHAMIMSALCTMRTNVEQRWLFHTEESLE